MKTNNPLSQRGPVYELKGFLKGEVQTPHPSPSTPKGQRTSNMLTTVAQHQVLYTVGAQ